MRRAVCYGGALRAQQSDKYAARQKHPTAMDGALVRSVAVRWFVDYRNLNGDTQMEMHTHTHNI